MSTRPTHELIKVHVTEGQRELLEFLINRRIRDIQNVTGQRTPELNDLIELKAELAQAGT